MKIVKGDNSAAIDQDQIDEFETLVAGKLPKDYKSFLLKKNGGRPKPNIFKTKNGAYESDIQLFYGIRDDQYYYNITHQYQTFKSRIPKNTIPIANDSIGNVILLNLKTGKIYFFDHEMEKIFLIADSFKIFTKNLYKLDIEESELDRAIESQDLEYFKKIISEGTPIDEIKNEFDQPIPVVAALYNKVKLLKFFLDNNASYEEVFSSACGRGRIEVVKYLLSSDLDINLEEKDKDVNNDTSLIQAAYGGHLEVVKLLIAKGADIHAKDTHGRTALDKSRWSNNQALVDYLEKEIYI